MWKRLCVCSFRCQRDLEFSSRVDVQMGNRRKTTEREREIGVGESKGERISQRK